MSTLAVSLPANLVALAREEGASPWAFGASIGPWFAALCRRGRWSRCPDADVPAARPLVALPLVLAIAAAYLAVMMPELRTAPARSHAARTAAAVAAAHAAAGAPPCRGNAGVDVMNLNIGCGRVHRAGAVNLDISPDVGADVVHDLNCLPWPFHDGQFEQIYAYDVLEHVNDVPRVLEEIHRVSRPGALLHVTVPHFSSANAFTDLTHRHYFSWRSFDPYFAGRRARLLQPRAFPSDGPRGSASIPALSTASCSGSPIAGPSATSAAGPGCFRPGFSTTSSRW